LTGAPDSPIDRRKREVEAGEVVRVGRITRTGPTALEVSA
jgi:hypothetical protein